MSASLKTKNLELRDLIEQEKKSLTEKIGN